MASTMVMEKDGLLVNSKGVNGESGRMKKLASRMLGGNSSKATLNYGWNGADELEISKGGQEGEKITLNAATTVVTGDLRVGNESIFDLLDQASAAALAGINGVPGEIKVYSDSSDEAFMIGLDPEFLRKIEAMDAEIDDLIVASGGYSIGDGLSLDTSSGDNLLSVKLGNGLKFQNTQIGGAGGRPVTLDIESTPTPDSTKPVTSGGVYAADAYLQLQIDNIRNELDEIGELVEEIIGE